MQTADKVFAGSIPDLYDRYMVPLIFAAYARDLARRIATEAPGAVLEIAAGTGALTRELAPLLQPGAAYTVTDLNQPMLDHAAKMQPDAGRISWRQADALHLAFEDASFDAVCCQFGVMFYPDKVEGYREARRVLRPGGRFVFNSWDGLESNVFAERVNRAVGQIFPDDPPAFMARTPHGYNDPRMIAEHVRAAGFAEVDVLTLPETSRAQTARDVAIAFCQGTPLRNELETRGPGRLDEITTRVSEALAGEFGAGPVSAPMQAHVVVAWN